MNDKNPDLKDHFEWGVISDIALVYIRIANLSNSTAKASIGVLPQLWKKVYSKLIGLTSVIDNRGKHCKL